MRFLYTSVPSLFAALCILSAGCISALEHGGERAPMQEEDANIRPVTTADLSTFQPGATKSRYRILRNAAYAYLLERKEPGLDIDGTYTLETPPCKVELKDGWQVSFQTTLGDGLVTMSHNGFYVSDEDYDGTVEALSKLTGSAPYLGISGGIAEISFRCETRELAMEIAERYNQSCIADNARTAAGRLDEEAFPRNPHYDWRMNQLFKTR